jgi:hypothetical protein
VSLLLDQRAFITAKAGDGRTAMDAACAKDHRNVVEVLVKRGALASIATAAQGGKTLRNTNLDERYLRLLGLAQRRSTWCPRRRASRRL